MARDVTVDPAQAEDLERLSAWYESAGISSTSASADAEHYRQAFDAGCLGSACGNGFGENLDVLSNLPMGYWAYARTSFRVLRREGTSIGALIMTPNAQLMGELYAHVDGPLSLDNPSPAWVNFVTTALTVAKIRAVVVDPEHQRRGHGTRLLRIALETARRDELVATYGQFATERAHLAGFYERLGFPLLESGESLPIPLVTGNPANALVGSPSERFFVPEQKLSRPKPR